MKILIISGILINMLTNPGSFDSVNDILMRTLSEIDARVYSETEPGGIIKISVDVTAYSPMESETDSTPFITASNKKVREGYIAISRDLEEFLNFGDKVFIEDVGIFEVQDRMNRRWEKRVDVFFHNTKKAVNFGKLQKKMWILENRYEKEKLAREKY